MKVTIVCVGKLKEKYWRDAIAEYSKRLSRYMKLEIIELADEKRVEGIADVVDHSSMEGMRVVIELKRDAVPQVVLNQLYAYTQMQVTFGAIMLALVDGVPRVLTLKEMLEQQCI